MAMERLSPGKRVRDYTIIRPLGRPGGQATTYLAEKKAKTIGIKFVLKQLRAREYDRADAVREARKIVEAGRRSNVVKVIDAFEHAGQAYVVMEYIEGPTLEERFERLRSPMSEIQWWRILRPLLHDMNHIHSQTGDDDDSKPVVHGDIKPANIILKHGDDGAPVLVDFGGAQTAGRVPDHLLYTELYACPEARSGEVAAEPQFDLFSVAVMSYEAMFGDIPAKNSAVRARRRNRVEPDTAKMRGNLHRRHGGFSAAIARALHPNPNERPESVLDWLGEMAAPVPVPQAAMQTKTVASIREAIQADFGLSKDAVNICDADGKPYDGRAQIDTVVGAYGQDYRFDDDVVAEWLETRRLKAWIESRYTLPPGSIRFYRPDGNEYGRGSGLANQTQLKTLLDLWRNR